MQTKLPSDNRQDSDSKFNPGNDHANNLFSQTSTTHTLDQMEASLNNPDDTAEAEERKNLQMANHQAAQALQAPEDYNYSPSENKTQPGGLMSKISGAFKNGGWRKKSPLLGVIALIGIGGFGISTLLLPLSMIHLTENLFDDLNDQDIATKMRTKKVLKAKISGLQATGICNNTVQIRCKFNTFNEKSVKAFRDAGFEIDGDEKSGGRIAVKNMVHVDPETGTRTPINTPQDLIDKSQTNRAVANSTIKAFNPRYAMVGDANANRVHGGKYKRLTGTTVDAIKKSFNAAIEKSKTGTPDIKPGNTGDDENNRTNDVPKVDGTGFASVMGNAAKGIGVTGAIDSACTVRTTLKVVGATAKIIKHRQLIAFAMIAMNFAGSVKAGDATAEEAEMVGDMFSAIDTQAMVVNETSPVENGVPQPVENPYYGQNGFDAPGVEAALYNDAPMLTARDMQFLVGGGLVGTLAVVNDKIDSVIGVGGANTCKIVTNPIVRIGSGVIGITLGVFTGGGSIAASVGASLAFALALPIAEAYLVDMLSGTVVDADTKGVDAGNALFAGTGAMLGSIAMSRGMKPAKAGELDKYLALSEEVNAPYIAYEKDKAKSTPFDVMNRYSFMGSLARTVLPVAQDASKNTTMAILSVPRFFSTAIMSLSPTASARQAFNYERFQQCNDSAYADLNGEEAGQPYIDADVFCNVRYTMDAKALSLETNDVLNYMYEQEQINDTGGPTVKSAYEKWVSTCVTREAGWGEIPSEEKQDETGDICVLDEYGGYDVAYFRAYTMDQSISMAIDGEIPETEAGDNGGGSNENSGEVNPEGWSFPTKKGAPITGSSFQGMNHPGLDIGLPDANTPIYAARDGEVTHAGAVQPYEQPCTVNGVQQHVKIKHMVDGQEVYTTYHHVEAGSITVSVGDKVKGGDKIANMGNTGCSYGQHLHFEMWAGRPWGSAPIDPTPIYY